MYPANDPGGLALHCYSPPGILLLLKIKYTRRPRWDLKKNGRLRRSARAKIEVIVRPDANDLERALALRLGNSRPCGNMKSAVKNEGALAIGA
jgi:hypothetical protein